MKLKTLLIVISAPALIAMSIIPVATTACSNNLVWNFNQSNFALYDNKVKPLLDGNYDTLSVGKDYNKNFVKNFCVDFRHYIQGIFGYEMNDLDMNIAHYNVEVLKHKFDAKNGLIKDFQFEMQLDGQIRGKNLFTLNMAMEIHNSFLVGAFTPGNIYYDTNIIEDPRPEHATLDKDDSLVPISGNYLSFAPKYDYAGWRKHESLSSCSWSASNASATGASNYFGTLAVSPGEIIPNGVDSSAGFTTTYFKSYVLANIKNIKPVALPLPNGMIHLTNNLINKTKKCNNVQDFCTYDDLGKITPGAWFPLNDKEVNKVDWQKSIDLQNYSLYSAYASCFPSNMQSFKINGKKYSLLHLLTSVKLTSYEGKYYWDPNTGMCSNLELNLAVNPCFSLGNFSGVRNGYITANAEKQIYADLYQSNHQLKPE